MAQQSQDHKGTFESIKSTLERPVVKAGVIAGIAIAALTGCAEQTHATTSPTHQATHSAEAIPSATSTPTPESTPNQSEAASNKFEGKIDINTFTTEWSSFTEAQKVEKYADMLKSNDLLPADPGPDATGAEVAKYWYDITLPIYQLNFDYKNAVSVEMAYNMVDAVTTNHSQNEDIGAITMRTALNSLLSANKTNIPIYPATSGQISPDKIVKYTPATFQNTDYKNVTWNEYIVDGKSSDGLAEYQDVFEYDFHSPLAFRQVVEVDNKTDLNYGPKNPTFVNQ